MDKPDPRKPLVIDTHDLGRRAGNQEILEVSVPAPSGMGNEVMAVPEGALIDLDLRLEAVLEGILVSGTVAADAEGECVRCLTEISDVIDTDVQELYFYEMPEGVEDPDEVSLVVDEIIDLEPLVRDAIVLELPLTPLCRPDCLGLCPECGFTLNDDPDHHHDAAIDPRWAGLSGLEPSELE